MGRVDTKRQELRQFMGRRADGYWGLVATAVGDARAVRRTSEGLSATALHLATSGPAISPNLVEQRIQALAALDPGRIQTLSSTWKPIDKIGRNLMDSEMDFWTAAWCSAIRFLAPFPAPAPTVLAGLPLALQREIDVVCCPARQRAVDWKTLIERLHHGPQLTYDELRKIGASMAMEKRTLSRGDLHDLLGSEEPSNAALERLRVLVTSRMSFSHQAVDFLTRLFCDQWFTDNGISSERGGVLVLVQLLLGIGVGEDLYGRAVERLLSRMQSDSHPDTHARFAYLLAFTSWTCP